MEIIKDKKIVPNTFRHLHDDDELPDTGDITVSLGRYLANRAVLGARKGQVGVRLGPADDPDELRHDLTQLSLVAVEFPKFTDGRGYSTARILREKYAFAGELRAIGNVLRDQIFYMHRCGVNSFELSPGKSVTDALKAFNEFTVTYQAGADDRRPLYRRGVRSA